MLIARTQQDLQQAGLCGAGLALVPTMGALHDGHVSLIALAKRHARHVAASIFINPLQFNAPADLSRYPRTEEEDLRRLRDAGCDLVWLPSVETMYPPQHSTIISMQGPALRWEGATRPGHFNGVATVVAKLLAQTRPDYAVFGEKDWQQLQVIHRMTTDLSMPVQILHAPTIREHDGLAMSSRNRFLTPAERKVASVLYEVLQKTAAALKAGHDLSPALTEARHMLLQKGFGVDYFDHVDAVSLEPSLFVPECTTPTRLIAATQLGQVRLLDNIAL